MSGVPIPAGPGTFGLHANLESASSEDATRIANHATMESEGDGPVARHLQLELYRGKARRQPGLP